MSINLALWFAFLIADIIVFTKVVSKEPNDAVPKRRWYHMVIPGGGMILHYQYLMNVRKASKKERA